jgi:hypothetical protein
MTDARDLQDVSFFFLILYPKEGKESSSLTLGASA